jgi:hypothetical protein
VDEKNQVVVQVKVDDVLVKTANSSSGLSGNLSPGCRAQPSLALICAMSADHRRRAAEIGPLRSAGR